MWAGASLRAGAVTLSPRESYGRALIDGETPVPAHARFFWLQTLVY